MKELLAKFERFMRIDNRLSAGDLLRARAVYMVAWVFTAAQLINMVFMTYVYGGWTIDCLLYTSPSPRDRRKSRMPFSA